MGADGNFWFTLSNSNEVARITPRGNISYFVTPTLSNPAFITPGPDGNIWFGEGSTGKIASVTPAGVVTEYQFSFFGVSVGITTGSDGNIWFTDQTDNAVWRYDLSSGIFTEFKTADAEFLSRATLRRARMATCGSPSRRWANSPASPRAE